MNNQSKTLFDRPLCRTNDPETSVEAADRMIKSGKLTEQEQEVWKAIRTWVLANAGMGLPTHFTAKELSHSSGIDYYVVQRRLSGLHNKGKIERTDIKREGCYAWQVRAK